MLNNPRIQSILKFTREYRLLIVCAVVAFTLTGLISSWKATYAYYFDPLPKQEVVQKIWLPPYFANITKGEKKGFAQAVQPPGMTITVSLEELQKRHIPEGNNQFLVLDDGAVVYFSVVDGLTYQANHRMDAYLEWEEFCNSFKLNSRLCVVRKNPRLEGEQLVYTTIERPEWKTNFSFVFTAVWALLWRAFLVWQSVGLVDLIAVCVYMRWVKRKHSRTLAT